jgi:hypothetical protein
VRASLRCRYLFKGMSTRFFPILNIIVSLDCLRRLSWYSCRSRDIYVSLVGRSSTLSWPTNLSSLWTLRTQRSLVIFCITGHHGLDLWYVSRFNSSW